MDHLYIFEVNWAVFQSSWAHFSLFVLYGSLSFTLYNFNTHPLDNAI